MTRRMLDDRTIERLAKIIVDQDGPYNRRGYELEGLLRRAAWTDPPEYDGSQRVLWLADQMSNRNGTLDVEHLICRVCDPIEYDGGAAVAKDFLDQVNSVLRAEQLVVTLVGQRPVLAGLSASDGAPMFSEPEDLERRLVALVKDEAARTMLSRRLAETRICEANGAYTFAIIGIGSMVEGILFAILLERDAEFRAGKALGRDRKPVRLDFASLDFLINRAHAMGFLQFDATKFMHNVRDFRNFIHPRKELAEQPDFDRDSVMLCWGPVRALLNDLEERLLGTESAVSS
ncbi:hypothetical protein ACXJJ3_28800 [Kribbella sp. WER1]